MQSTEVHDGVGVMLDDQNMILRFVLMLMIGFRFILGDEKVWRISVTFVETSYFPPSVMRVAMAPCLQMLSGSALTNCLRFLIPYTSQTKVSHPQKCWAMVVPSSIAQVSLMTVSVASFGGEC